MKYGPSCGRDGKRSRLCLSCIPCVRHDRPGSLPAFWRPPWQVQSKGALMEGEEAPFLRKGKSQRQVTKVAVLCLLLKRLAITVVKIQLYLISSYFLHACKCHISNTNKFPLSSSLKNLNDSNLRHSSFVLCVLSLEDYVCPEFFCRELSFLIA